MMASWTRGSHRMPLLPGARTAALLRPAPTILAATRQLSSGGGNGQRRETLLEKNDRLREASEANLEKSRKALIEDMGSRNQEMSSLREVIREKVITLHKPPQALYSQQGAFRFPAIQAQSLAGDEVNLSTSSGGLFSNNKWTLLGCASSNFAQQMVDSWLDSATPLLTMKAADEDEPRLQVRWLSFVEGRLMSWLRRPLMASMRSSVPKDRHSTFLCNFAVDTVDVRKALLMQNKYLGYVCLVDPKGVVRWHVHGNELPNEQELSHLTKLMKRGLTEAR